MKHCLLVVLLSWAPLLLLFAGGTAEEQENAVLEIGLMPAVDAAPIFVASDAGYFDEAGIEVGMQVFTNAQDRQSALQAGQLDGAMTDLVALAVNVAGGFDIRATMLTDGMFPVLAVPGAVQKRGVRIGLMEVSVVNFLVDQWLGDDYRLEKVYINAIPARLEAVASAQLDMGIFPEPVSSVGQLKGLDELIYEPAGGITPDVLVFTGAAIAGKSAAIQGFHDAYNRAVADINADSGLALETLMVHVPNIHPDTRGLINLPTYTPARLPEPQYLQALIDWTSRTVGADLDVEPADLVDRRFVQSSAGHD